ncbi:MAG: hemerythrin domain-containing protein [Myxococcaceae bacterium]
METTTGSALQHRNVSTFLEADHRRLDTILQQADHLLGQDEHQEASGWLSQLSAGLGWHINVQETVLFPMMARAGGLEGPLSLMRDEHREIRRLIQDCERHVARGRGGAAGQTLSQLALALEAHRRKEELIYPLADQLAGSDRERDALVRQMEQARPAPH